MPRSFNQPDITFPPHGYGRIYKKVSLADPANSLLPFTISPPRPPCCLSSHRIITLPFDPKVAERVGSSTRLNNLMNFVLSKNCERQRGSRSKIEVGQVAALNGRMDWRGREGRDTSWKVATGLGKITTERSTPLMAPGKAFETSERSITASGNNFVQPCARKACSRFHRRRSAPLRGISGVKASYH